MVANIKKKCNSAPKQTTVLCLNPTSHGLLGDKNLFGWPKSSRNYRLFQEINLVNALPALNRDGLMEYTYTVYYTYSMKIFFKKKKIVLQYSWLIF